MLAATMVLSLVTAVPMANVAYARSRDKWPGYELNEYVEIPPKKIFPYVWGNPDINSELTPSDIKVNIDIENTRKVDDLIKAGCDNYYSYERRRDIEYSCFNKFQLTRANEYGIIGFYNYLYSAYLPYIPAANTRAGLNGMASGGFGQGGYAFHFFDYPDDTNKPGDDDFLFEFSVKLDYWLREASLKKGNLQARLVVEVLDTKGDHAKALFTATTHDNENRVLGDLVHVRKDQEGKWVQWTHNWADIPVDTNILTVTLYSTDGWTGEGANDAELKMPRVILKDASKPKVESVTIQTIGLQKSYNNVYDPFCIDPRYRAKVGDVIRYAVAFDEPVICIDSTRPVLNISTNDGKTLKAYMDPNDKYNDFSYEYYFYYVLQEGDQIKRDGEVVYIENCDAFVDVGRNRAEPKQTVSKQQVKGNAIYYNRGYSIINLRNVENIVICDSESPYIPVELQKEDGGFVARKMTSEKWSESSNPEVLKAFSTEARNGIPEGLKASTTTQLRQYIQDEAYSLNSSNKPIFRVVLADMIDNKYLKLAGDSDPLKLKLNIFDSKKNVISGRDAYAELIAYRYVGQNLATQNRSYQGTNEGRTELYFAYTPKAEDFMGLNQMELYSVDIAAEIKTVKNKEGKYERCFVFGSDLFSKELSDFAGNKVGQLTFPVEAVNSEAVAPADNYFKIDLADPDLRTDLSTMPGPELVKNLQNVKLIFEEKGSLKSAEIKVYKRPKGTGELEAVKLSKHSVTFGKQNNDSLYFVSIQSLSINDSDPDISDRYYMVYSVEDTAGNITTNEGQGIPVNFDVLPPVPDVGSDGKWYDVDRNQTGESAAVTFRLEDASPLADQYSYYVDYTSTISSYRGTPAASTANSDQSVAVSTGKGTRTSVTVWAKFADKVGNVMKNYLSTDPIVFDTRKIDAEYYCDYCMDRIRYGIPQKTYDLYVKLNKNPFPGAGTSAKEGTLVIRYKWVPAAMENTPAVQRMDWKEISYTSEQKEC